MAVNLVTLIKATPFKEETRQKLLAGLESMSEKQRFVLSQTCWTALSQLYFAKVRYKRDKSLLEIQEGKKKFDKKEFDEMEKEVAKEFADKLKSAESESSIEDIRNELKKYTQQNQPATPSPPPASADLDKEGSIK